ncbi:MAG TPA: FMN-binding protein [Mobilitalea sp.]|nr:FMN-binding protein [Mobilitalea sp.]
MTNNKEKKSSIIKDAIALTIITVICSFALAFVYEITKTPIKEQEEAKKNAGYKAVFADADKLFTDEELVSKAAETDLSALDSDLAGVTVGDVIQALDENGNLLGYIVTSKTRGYASTINLAIGYSLDGTVKGIEFLEIGETVGFGMNADTPEFKSEFTGVKTDHFIVKKGGGTSDNEIDVVSGATVTTTAVVKAVNGGIAFLKEYAEGLGGAANE